MDQLKKFLIPIMAVLFFIQPIHVHAKSKIDIVFIIDRSGSMGDDINDVRNEIKNFTEKLEQQGLDYRLGLISYESTPISYPLTSNVETFKSNLSDIRVRGGTENGLDAILEAMDEYIFYDNAMKYFVLVGDEEIFSANNYSEQDITNLLKSNDIILTGVGDNLNEGQFKRISSSTGGLYLDLDSNFSINLEKIFDQIQAIPMLDVISPTQNQLLSDFDTSFIPTIKASDADSDKLYFAYYIDGETTPRDTKTVSNTATWQTVSFDALNIGTLSEGNHKLRFTVNDGSDTVENIINIKVDINPPTLGNVTFKPTDTSILISGSAADNISGLNNNPYKFTVGNNITPWMSNTSHTENNLTPNTRYQVKFEARDRVGHIANRQNIIYTRAQIPNVTLENYAETSFDIHMRDNNPGTTEYQIRVGNSYLSQTGRLTSTATWITLNNKRISANGLSSNTSYNVTARARNNDRVETAYSTQVGCSTLAKSPSNIKLTPTKNSIDISWDIVSGVSGYDIEVDGSVINNGTSTSYIHSGLAPDTQHTYRIRSRNAGGLGNWSSLVSEYTLPNPPNIPSNINTSLEQTKVEINWDPVIGAKSYDIEADGQIIDNGSNTTFIHEGLSPQTQHTYRIKAKNRGGESNWSETITVITLPYPPEAPININKEITKNSIKLMWSEMERATGYEIEVDGLIMENEEKTSYLHEGLEPLSGHTYRIRAKNRGGKSPWSSQIDITTHPEKPNTPTNLMATSEENSISVIWYKVPNAEKYDVEIDGSVITDITDTVYVHKGLNPDSKHIYRVRAKNISGISEWSSPLTMSTLPNVQDGDNSQLNIALTNIVAVVTNKDITISWDAVAPNVEYEVEVDGELKDNGENTIYKHSGLEANTYHNYKIRVRNEEGVSNWCGVLSLSTLPNLPDAPVNVEAYSTNNSIELKWESIEGATGYDVEVDGQTINNGVNTNYLHIDLEPGTEHTYRIRAKNITGVTAWSNALVESTTNPTYTINVTKDKTFDLSLLASNVQDFTELKFIVTYNPDEVEVVDLYNFTPEKDLINNGNIPNSNLDVTYTPGKIEFTVDKSIVPGTSWSGEISDILFKSRVDGQINIDFTIE